MPLEFKPANFPNPKTKMDIKMYFRETTENAVLFTGDYMEVYVPADNFDRKLASMKGKELTLFGLIKLRIWNTGVDKAGKPSVETNYKLPYLIETVPNTMVKRTMVLDEEENTFMVLIYQKHDIFIKATKVPKFLTGAKVMINTLFEGFMPSVVNYEDIPDLIATNAAMSDVDFVVTPAAWSCLIAELNRSKNDENVPIRKIINKVGKGKVRKEDIKVIKIADLPYITSTFASLAFQDIEYAITSSARRERTGGKSAASPVEDAIKY